MLQTLSECFQTYGLDLWAPIALEHCSIKKSYLLERAGIRAGTAIILAVPYYTKACESGDRNLSAYAVSRDYHGFFRRFFGEILPFLRNKFPQERFEGFADHSPIAEVEAAARAGLGVIGENHLLITEKYSSYIFLGELITSASLPSELHPIGHCHACGRCKQHCPMEDCGGCLSALTQKKGELTPEEETSLLRYGSVWGCDICQEVCPYTLAARKSGSIFSPVSYFQEQSIPHLTVELLDSMSDEEFENRAFAWRGRQTIRRNLLLAERDGNRSPNCDADSSGQNGAEKGNIC